MPLSRRLSPKSTPVMLFTHTHTRSVVATIVALPLLLFFSACDSDPGAGPGKTSFLVRYEAEGFCPTISAVGYTIDGGGTAGSGVNLPWSFETTIDTSGRSGPVAVALAVNCLAGVNVTHTLTARIFVDGDLKEEQTSSSMSTFSVNVGTVL